jgi:putative transposase
MDTAGKPFGPRKKEVGRVGKWMRLTSRKRSRSRGSTCIGRSIGLGLATQLASCSAPRGTRRGRRYFENAIAENGVLETVTIDKSATNLAGLNAINADCEVPIRIQQSTYLNNVVVQDHPEIKRIVRPRPGLSAFVALRIISGSIELMPMIAKGQMKRNGGRHRSVAETFYDLEK